MAIDPSQGYPHTDYGASKYAGDAKQQAIQYVLDIDTAMRVNYAANIYSIGRNIYPILYAESTFDGGRYTLMKDKNTSFVHQNVGVIYDQVKAICHIPLGIFSILSAYVNYPQNQQWKAPLLTYQDQILLVQNNLDRLDFPMPIARTACSEIIRQSLVYTRNVNLTNAFTMEDFAAYSHKISGEIGFCQTIAAQEQVNSMNVVLNSWKGMLGQEEWDKMYVVVSAIWTLSQESAQELIIKATMKPELRETHLIVSEAVPTIEDAKTLLGRIVGDRIMAKLVFDPNSSDKTSLENIYSLSTRRDLLSQAIEAIIGDMGSSRTIATVGCPHLAGQMN